MLMRVASIGKEICTWTILSLVKDLMGFCIILQLEFVFEVINVGVMVNLSNRLSEECYFPRLARYHPSAGIY